MYKILLADEEGVSVNAIRHSILQHFGETCDVRTAKNARQVFEVFQSFAPDIVFLNVQMSGIQGIYSIRKLHSIHPDALYIAMSHSGRINYNREGAYMHIIKYLKKPVGRDTAIRALSEALSQLDREREMQQRRQLNKEKLQTVIPVIENGFISELLCKGAKSEHLSSYRELLNIPARFGWIMTLDFCENAEDGRMSNPVGATVSFHEQQKQFRAIIKAFFPGAVIGPPLANRVVIFIPCRSDAMTAEETDFRQDRTEHMMKQLGKKMDLYFKLGIGSPKKFEEIGESLNEAVGTSQDLIP